MSSQYKISPTASISLSLIRCRIMSSCAAVGNSSSSPTVTELACLARLTPSTPSWLSSLSLINSKSESFFKGDIKPS